MNHRNARRRKFMKIAVAGSRKEKIYENKEVSWEEFCHMVSQTKRTSETMVEYYSFLFLQQPHHGLEEQL